MSIETIPTFQDGEKYLDCILISGDHDFISTEDTPKQIASNPNLYSVNVVCVECGYQTEKYILENSEL